MSNTTKAMLYVKIAEDKWAEKLKDGCAWFGTINGYIKKAEEEHNDEQGDKYEGVFARLKKGSPVIEECFDRYGDDLESFEENGFVLLRRKSSKRMCAFCVYGIHEGSNLEIISEEPYKDGLVLAELRYVISKEMFEKFLNGKKVEDEEATGVYMSPGHLDEALQKAMERKGRKFRRGVVVYDIDLTTEFCLDLDNVVNENYGELFHKRKDLSYQNECRTIIWNNDPEKNGIAVHYKRLRKESCFIVEHDKAGHELEFVCSIKKPEN